MLRKVNLVYEICIMANKLLKQFSRQYFHYIDIKGIYIKFL